EVASWVGVIGGSGLSLLCCSWYRYCGSPTAVSSFIISSDMVDSGYLRALALSLAGWLSLYLIFTWTIDPYGVSPARFSLPGINALKPKRLDIDRLIKPYEVWRYQPRTIFLGTFCAHQSLDPSVLDGTRFAPAYNASMPAGSMEMNAAYLRQYLRLDSNLHTVIVELFLPSFIGAAIRSPHWLTTWRAAGQPSKSSPADISTVRSDATRRGRLTALRATSGARRSASRTKRPSMRPRSTPF